MKKAILLALILLAVVPTSYAYLVKIQANSNVANFNSDVYKCANYACSQLSNFQHINSGATQNSYSLSGLANDYYIEFDHKECSRPGIYGITVPWYALGNYPHTVNFEKKANCTGLINNITLSSSSTGIGKQVRVAANVHSAFEYPSGVPKTLVIPENIKAAYSSLTKVSFYANDVKIGEATEEVLLGGNKELVFDWTPAQAGDYQIKAVSDIVDCSCDLTSAVIQTTTGASVQVSANCLDADNDGHNAIAGSCEGSDDCDDNNANIYTGADEACGNNLDDDCDGLSDMSDEECIICEDEDEDGYYSISAQCPQSDDCDDNDASIHPGVIEVCFNSIDDDCDESTDMSDSECSVCTDADGDGYIGSAAAVPVYRFYGNKTEDHLYTISEREKEKVLSQYADSYIYEGEGFYAYSGKVGDSLPVYRFLNNATGGHFYTIKEAEKEKILNQYASFIYEGAAFYAYATQVDGTVPVYRLFSPVSQTHFYTIKEAEKNKLLTQYANVWTYEGAAFYVYSDPSVNSCPGAADCKDSNADVNPGAYEDCGNSIDDDCDGLIDIADLECQVCTDSDLDGAPAQSATCMQGDDCDDTNPFIYVGAPENCNNLIDDDCDSLIDINDDECIICTDLDGDGYFLDSVSCPGSDDCDDYNTDIHPGVVENCANFVDDDCDGLLDLEDEECSTACLDLDSDDYMGSASTVPVYRLYGNKTEDHLFTTSEREKEKVLNIYGDRYIYEGEAFNVYQSQISGSLPVYRFFNNATGGHFYTIQEAEKDKILSQYPHFIYEGKAFYAYTTQEEGTVPVYRFLNQVTGTHFYTPKESEKTKLMTLYSNVWTYEKVAFYAYAEQMSKVCPGSIDCDDYNSEIYPSAVEVCDGKDNDCDSAIDETCECINGQTRECGTDIGECSKEQRHA